MSTAGPLAARLSALHSDAPWREPRRFELGIPEEREKLDALIDEGCVTRVIDPIREIAEEAYFLQDGADFSDDDARAVYAEALGGRGICAGVWVHFPWSGHLVRFPDPEQHLELRTFRNRNLITADEQRLLARMRVAVIGLSVGSNIVEQLVQLGIGSAYLLSDHDVLSPTNLNRVRASMANVGEAKTCVLAKKISEIDPFLDLSILPDGLGVDGHADLTAFGPDIVFDEVDDLSTKARLRIWAARHKVPLLMVSDTGEKSVLSVERHDLEAVRPFNGRLSHAEFDRLVAGDLPRSEQDGLLIKIVGARHLSVRLLRSALEIGHTLGGIPQLSSAATAGAAVASVATREILTGSSLRSGTYVVHPRRLLKVGRQAGLRSGYLTIKDVRAHLRTS